MSKDAGKDSPPTLQPCPKCHGKGFLLEWLVEGKIGDCFIEKIHKLACWRCKGKGVIE